MPFSELAPIPIEADIILAIPGSLESFQSCVVKLRISDTIHVAKAKPLINCEATAQLICVFVLA